MRRPSLTTCNRNRLLLFSLPYAFALPGTFILASKTRLSRMETSDRIRSAVLRICALILMGTGSSYNSSLLSPVKPSGPSDLSVCGTPNCNVDTIPYTLSYPLQDFVRVKTQTVVATVIPFVTVSDGETVTQSSTYLQYGPDPTDVVTWTPPQSSLLTWSTLGTVL
jgi:hypothetical protein